MGPEALERRWTLLVESACGSPQRILRGRFEGVQAELQAARAQAALMERERACLGRQIAQLEVALRVLEEAIEVPFASPPPQPSHRRREPIFLLGTVMFCCSAVTGCTAYLSIFGAWPTWLWLRALATVGFAT